MHNRKQQLLFLKIVDKYIESLYLPKIIEKYERNLTQKQRKYIDEQAELELSLDEDKIKVLTLFYCLRVQNPTQGYMSMLTKKLIQETNIEFTEDNVKEINDSLNSLLKEMGLPEIQKGKKQFILNVGYYEDDFIRKYPDIKMQ